MTGAALYFDRVSHGYGEGPWVLQCINLAVRPGEWLAVMGPSGSGKSTLARIAAGLLRPRQGRVHAARAGYVAQDPQANIIGETVAEDVSFAPTVRGEDRLFTADTALRAVGMEWATSRPMAALSGGELQRVAIAGALASGARLLVLDEPTSHLSAPAARGLWQVVEPALRQAGIAVLLVTHRVEEAKRADRIAILSRGKLAVYGPACALARRPRLVESLGVAADPVEAVAGWCEEAGVSVGWPAGEERLVAAVCSLLGT